MTTSVRTSPVSAALVATNSRSAAAWVQLGGKGGAFATGTSNTAGILQAIADIATSAIPVGGFKLRGVPDAREIRSAGWPYLCVMKWQEIGGLLAGRLVRGRIPRQSGMSYPVRSFLAYLLYQNRDPENPLTHSTPEWARDVLEAAFTAAYTLNGTCTHADILECCMLPEFSFVSGDDHQPYVAVKLLLEVQEQIPVDYTGT